MLGDDLGAQQPDRFRPDARWIMNDDDLFGDGMSACVLQGHAEQQLLPGIVEIVGGDKPELKRCLVKIQPAER